MNKLKKRILSLITAAAVAFSAVALPDMGILPGQAVTASAETNTQILEYLATDGTLTTLNENATTVTNSTTSWSNGWYVVSTDVTIADRITVSGTVNLILCDGATLTASKGITVGSSATFNVYAQTDDEAIMGALVADGTNDKPNWYAGIGGVENTDAGMITINGGQINATGWCAAGIGSGGGTSTVGTITINGGIVTAQDNAHYGAGIGGGFSGGKVGTINLNGGVINAAGIGSGYLGGDCSITVNISDGVKKIVATPVQGGACIGKGASASGSVTVNFISGGNIVTGDAKGDNYSYGEWKHRKQGTSWKARLAEYIDSLIPLAKDLDELLKIMEAHGYTIKRGMYISVKAPGQRRAVRLHKLGVGYSEEELANRINAYLDSQPRELNNSHIVNDGDVAVFDGEDVGYYADGTKFWHLADFMSSRREIERQRQEELARQEQERLAAEELRRQQEEEQRKKDEEKAKQKSEPKKKRSL